MEPKSSGKDETNLKLKAKIVNEDEIYYTIQVYPVNVDWKYSDSELAYTILGHKFKNEVIRQIVRNVFLKHKEPCCDLIKLGSKEYLFEAPFTKGIETDTLKQMFTLIANDIKNEIKSGINKRESFKKFLDESEF